MSSIGSITSATQAVYAGVAARKVVPAGAVSPARDADGDLDRSPPGGGIGETGKGIVLDVYA